MSSHAYAVSNYLIAGYVGVFAGNWRYVAEVTVWNADLAAEERHYFSDGRWITGPGDTPPHTAFLLRIQQPALLQRACFTGGATGGASRIGYGEMVLVNTDGALDFLITRGFDGREIIVRYGQEGVPYPEGWVTLLTGTMAAPGWEGSRLVLRIRDRMMGLDRNIQTALYAGDNVLPNGLEGVDEIKDRPKPLCYGSVYNVSAVLVNSSRLIYQVNDGAVQSISAVYDRGAALTAGAGYTSQSDMETNAPTAGTFRAWLAGGYFRLGATPAGLITADVTQGATAAQRTTAQVLTAIALRLGVDEADISVVDQAALDRASAAEVGIWLDQSASGLTVMDHVAEAAGAWYGFDATGVLRMALLTAPTGSPVADLSPWNIHQLEIQTSADGANAVPAWRVEVGYEHNYSVQNTDLAGSVSAARRGWLNQSDRSASAQDSAIQTAHPLSEPLTVTTPLVHQSDAQTEAARRLALFGVRRDRVKIRMQIDSSALARITLGAVVRVTYPRYGYDAGVLFRVLSLQLDLQLSRAELLLWG